MKHKDNFQAFKDIATLYQYLYAGNKVKFDGGMAILELSMTEDMTVLVHNTNFPEFAPQPSTFSLEHMVRIIGILRAMPSTYPTMFETYWEEIKEIAAAHVVLSS